MVRPLWIQRGGIAGLLDLIEVHGEAIHADLHRYHGHRLHDVFTGDLTWMDLLAYVRQFPPDSATARAMDGDAAGWGASEHLLATVIDQLAAANWQRSGKKSGKPKPMKRPRPPADPIGG